jgi:hypothetical protein
VLNVGLKRDSHLPEHGPQKRPQRPSPPLAVWRVTLDGRYDRWQKQRREVAWVDSGEGLTQAEQLRCDNVSQPRRHLLGPRGHHALPADETIWGSWLTVDF